MPDLTDRLDEIAARAEAAGEGPWAANGDSPYWENSVADPGGWPIGERMYRDDAAFIAASRTDVPALVAALRAVLDVIGPHYTAMLRREAKFGRSGRSCVCEQCRAMRAVTAALGVEP